MDSTLSLRTRLSLQDRDQLAQQVRGPVLLPDDEGYAQECAVFNLATALSPSIVVGATSAADVQAAVAVAARLGLPVAVKSTGHQVVTPAHGSLLITTHRMNAVAVDAGRRTARVAAGAVWQQVIDQAVPLGLAPVSGSMPGVGVVGYTLGGGLSPVFGRSHGYAADQVLALEIVTADGELRRVTPESDAELFRSVLGCKGNFGVVTALEFALVPQNRFYGGCLLFPGDNLADIVHLWREWIAAAPEEMSSSLAVQRFPDIPEVPEPLRGAFVTAVRIGYTGSAEEGERLVAPLRAVAPVLADGVEELSYAAAAAIHRDPDTPFPYHDRTLSLASFPAEAADAFVTATGPGSDCPLVSAEIRALGGALSRPPAVDNVVPGRGAAFLVFAGGVGGADTAPVMRAALSGLADALEPWADPRTDANFLSPEQIDGPDAIERWYGPENHARLVAAKKVWDPTNMFRDNYNIAPS
ncbi:FAD/FMN-containing dehydrogenase [Actinacidiphila alni]|uniref:FAD/FMN-containing dehydrogenase n=1 Tax=Actinacidiphila alni TaxID=380248 RepID=A0A1I2IZ80_9ACTN|nr:FAD-binding protein [Actinacidiphila alni]SFF47584.1 FAD/FMN-containing dehydrogenase [Actinacidiphila alni]